MATISIKQIKNAVRQVIAEKDEIGIYPMVIPPLVEQSTQVNTSVRTKDVVDSLIRHKEFKGVKEGAIKTYKKHLYYFARQSPYLPLETDAIMEYLKQFKGDTGRHKRNQYDRLKMLYDHAIGNFGMLQNPLDGLERPIVTQKQIQTLSLEEACKIDSTVYIITERVVWELTFGHGWRQVEVRRTTAGDVRSIRDGIIWCRGQRARGIHTPSSRNTRVVTATCRYFSGR